MKKIFILFALLIGSNQFAQTKLTYDKSGLLSKKDYDKLVAIKKYQLISAFDTVSMKPLLVYAIYLKNNKLGILDNSAKEITPAIYDGIEGLNISYTTVMFGFHENYPVKIGDKYGLISNTGKQILPVKYDYIHNEEKKSIKRNHKKEVVIDSVVVANLGNEELIFTPKGKLLKKNAAIQNNDDIPVIEEQRDYSYSRNNNDQKPSEKITTPYGNVYKKLDNNLALVQNKVDKFYFHGLVDLSSNKLLIPVEFNYITIPEKGKFITVKDKKFNLYNEKGELLLPETYENIEKFNKIYRLKKNGKLAIFDLDLKPLTDFIYDEFGSASADFMVALKDKKYGVIQPNGTQILPFEYEKIEAYFNRYETGVAFYKVKLNGKEGFISKEGKPLTEIIYESIVPECTIEEPSLYGETTMPIDHDYHDKNAYFIYKKDNKYGLLDNDFKNLIPNEYDHLQKSFHNDFVFVSKKDSSKKTNDVSSILNIRANKTIVSFDYNYFKYFGGNYFMISQGNKLGVCNFEGKIIIPLSTTTNYDERFYYNKIYQGLEIIDKRKDNYYIDSYKNIVLISDK